MECRISSELDARLRGGADARALGAAVAGAWAGMAHALQPVIGLRGVESLARRCVVLAAAGHSWLQPLAGAIGAPAGPEQVIDVFARQAAPDAAAGGAALLATMDALLESLVGASLTGRLLQPVWHDFFRSTAPQGHTP